MKNSVLIRNTWALLGLISVSVFTYSESSLELSVSNVFMDRNEISHSSQNIQKSTAENTILIRYRLNQPATAILKIYDARDYLVRSINSNVQLASGDHSFKWQGLDNKGQFVAPEVYHFVIEAKSNTGKTVVYDLTDRTGGELQMIEKIAYDDKKGQVSFVIPKSGRFYLRAGLDGSAVVRTLLNNEVRSEGHYTLPWDGKDKAGLVSVVGHPKLSFNGVGYRLSQNSIVVKSAKSTSSAVPVWASRSETSEKRKKEKRPSGLALHAYHKVDQCRDIQLSLELVNASQKNGVNIINRKRSVPLRAVVAAKDTLLIEAERSEIVYFLNEHMLFENEASYYPHTWIWAPTNTLAGEYTLSAFVVGYSGHYGTGFQKIRIQN